MGTRSTPGVIRGRRSLDIRKTTINSLRGTDRVSIKQWNLPCLREQAAEELAGQTGLPLLVSRVLCARGCATQEKADQLTHADTALSNPYRLRDMEKAVARIRKAMENGERIAVFGDYDCDGITATALLTGYLQTVGADVIYSVPDRERDGYGLNISAVDFLQGQNVELIITVDNGISSHEEIKYAKSLGIDVVVTDHHTPRETLPEAEAVVNPHRSDCESGLTELSGVGVAFKLICALEEDETGDEMLEYYADLVMIGTVADVVPLVGENRVIVRRGLAHIAQTERVGLSALIERSGVAGKSITSETIGYTIVPRLNAVGRMGPVDEAIELLLTDDFPYAWDIVGQMEDFNTQRKEIEQAMFSEIQGILAENPDLTRERLLMLAGEGWHHGVVGIVASRVMERTGKPCILFSLDEAQARGSARSIAGFSIIQAVTACSQHLTRYGGHTLAAGMTLLRENYDEFIREVADYARAQHPFMPHLSIDVDCVLDPKELSVENIAALSILEPYGAGNKAPCFLLKNLRVERITSLSEGKHIRLSLTGERTSFSAVYFRMSQGAFPYRTGDLVDVVANVSVSEYGGRQQVSVIVRDLRKSGVDQDAVIRSGEAYTCFLRGERDAVKEVDLLPSREEIALVYRYLRGEKHYRHGPLELYYRLSESGVEYAKVLAALDVLIEMGLIQAGGEGELICLPDPPKVDLEQSSILQALKAAEPVHT